MSEASERIRALTATPATDAVTPPSSPLRHALSAFAPRNLLSPCAIISLALIVMGILAVIDGPRGPGVGWGLALIAAGVAHRLALGAACGPPRR